MPPDRLPPEQREELWERFLAGQLDQAGAQELLNELEGDAAEMERRRADAALHAGLSYLLGPPQQTQQLVMSVQARLKETKPGTSSGRFARSVMADVRRKPLKSLRPKQPQRWFMRWPALAAATLLLAGMAVLFATRNAPPTQTAKPSSPTVAPELPQERHNPQEAILEVVRGAVVVNNSSGRPSSQTMLLRNNKATLTPDALVRLTLPEGSQLELSEGASLTLLDPQSGPRALLESGQALVHATKQADGSVFRLETPHATAAVVGTRYTARVFGGVSCVSVAEGRVAVSAKGSEPKGGAGQVLLQAGEELRAGASGLSQPLRSAGRRVLDPGLGTNEEGADPEVSSDVPGELFGGMTIRHLIFTQPKADGFCSLAWPVTLAPEEDRVEVWVRPRKIVPHNPGMGVAKVVLLAKLGTTEYRIGELHLTASDKGWLLLTGRLIEGATVNWVKPGTARIPLRAQSVQQLALRCECGELDIEHTGIVIWKR